MTLPLHAFAPAKINLTLHVCGRRDDGYHDLESVVAFASEGDSVSLFPGEELSLVASGPTAHLLGAAEENLVLKAVRALLARREGLKTGAFRLEKRLPISAGIGGGSSDAAAALRLVAQINDLPVSDPALREAALATGADVPVCLNPRARMMQGIGENLGDPLQLPKISAVLVNAGAPVATPAVFKALGLKNVEKPERSMHSSVASSLDERELLTLLRSNRNDLEAAACTVAPDIVTALDLLAHTTDCQLARMSGSGATVFGLYPDFDKAEHAAGVILRQRPHWWVRPVWLR